MRRIVLRNLRVIGATMVGVLLTGVAGLAQVVTSGPATCPGVALTFDLCPVLGSSGYDKPLFDLLLTRHVPATFFLSGRWITRHAEETKDLLTVPFFEIGTHGQVHAHLPLLKADGQQAEMLAPARVLRTRYHREATLFRPPYGEYDETTVETARKLGLQFILWSVVSGDPDPMLSAQKIKDAMERSVRQGSIIVLHANGKGRHTREVVDFLTADLLPRKGLRPMTITELLTCRAPSPP